MPTVPGEANFWMVCSKVLTFLTCHRPQWYNGIRTGEATDDCALQPKGTSPEGVLAVLAAP
jgi:hypothetical protein